MKYLHLLQVPFTVPDQPLSHEHGALFHCDAVQGVGRVPVDVRALGVEHFGQTGTIAELYRAYGIDANSIVAAAEAIAPGRPIRYLRAVEA